MTTVAEAAFQDHVWRPRLEPLRELALDVPALEVDTADGYRPALEQIVAFVTGE